MKIFFSLLLTLCIGVPALAQGRVNFINDSLHLVYWEPGGPGGGQPYLLGSGGGITLVIELWAGTSSTALGLVATTGFAQQANPGTWAGMNVTLPTPAGPTFFDIYIYDAAAGSYWGAITNFPHFHGTSGPFMAVASGNVAYNSLVNHNSPANSTWADGTYNMDFLSPGYRGAIELVLLPEPSNFGLACLSCTLLLVRRRAEIVRLKN